MKKKFIAIAIGALLSIATVGQALAAAPTCSIVAGNTTITRGQSTTLSWAATNSTKQTLSLGTASTVAYGGPAGGTLTVGQSGNVTVFPRGSMPFYLNVWNVVPGVGGSFVQCSVSITVLNA